MNHKDKNKQIEIMIASVKKKYRKQNTKDLAFTLLQKWPKNIWCVFEMVPVRLRRDFIDHCDSDKTVVFEYDFHFTGQTALKKI